MNVKEHTKLNQFNANHVKQIKSKNLYVAEYDSYKLLISYNTIIGILQGETWQVTTKKYSTTTSRQITDFSCDHTVTRIEQALLDDMLKSVGR